MISAHVIPKKGFSHEHGATELIKDIAKLGYNEIILKCSWRTRQLETVGRTEQPSAPSTQSQSRCE